MTKLGSRAFIIILLSLWIAGCETTTQPPQRSGPPMATVTVHEGIEVAVPAPIVEVSPPPVLFSTNQNLSAMLAPQGSSSLSAHASWPSNWINTWLSLEAWGQYNRLGKPQLVNSTPAAVYEYRTTNGTISLKVGSRVAYCNGLECWLGYAPQIIKGTPYIHGLDALKSFQALLNPRSYIYKPERIIVIDPGHGGKDSGSRNLFSTRWEKEYTLDWALRLRPLLQQKGWKVILTRTNDVDAPLADRVQLAEKMNADLFISLHFNSGSPNKELAGIETYCLTPTGLPSNLVRTYEDDPKSNFPNNAWDEQNFQVAYSIHRALLETSSAQDRGVRHARFMAVLRGQNRPAVLVEGGYLSNPNEAKKIAAAGYRQSLADALARALD